MNEPTTRRGFLGLLGRLGLGAAAIAAGVGEAGEALGQGAEVEALPAPPGPALDELMEFESSTPYDEVAIYNAEGDLHGAYKYGSSIELTYEELRRRSDELEPFRPRSWVLVNGYSIPYHATGPINVINNSHFVPMRTHAGTGRLQDIPRRLAKVERENLYRRILDFDQG